MTESGKDTDSEWSEKNQEIVEYQKQRLLTSNYFPLNLAVKKER